MALFRLCVSVNVLVKNCTFTYRIPLKFTLSGSQGKDKDEKPQIPSSASSMLHGQQETLKNPHTFRKEQRVGNIIPGDVPDLVVRVPFFDHKGITSKKKIEFEYAFYRAMVR